MRSTRTQTALEDVIPTERSESRDLGFLSRLPFPRSLDALRSLGMTSLLAHVGTNALAAWKNRVPLAAFPPGSAGSEIEADRDTGGRGTGNRTCLQPSAIARSGWCRVPRSQPGACDGGGRAGVWVNEGQPGTACPPGRYRSRAGQAVELEGTAAIRCASLWGSVAGLAALAPHPLRAKVPPLLGATRADLAQLRLPQAVIVGAGGGRGVGGAHPTASRPLRGVAQSSLPKRRRRRLVSSRRRPRCVNVLIQVSVVGPHRRRRRPAKPIRPRAARATPVVGSGTAFGPAATLAAT